MNEPSVDVSSVVIVGEDGDHLAIHISAVHATEGYGWLYLAPAEEAELLRVLTARANNEPEYPTGEVIG